MLSIDFVFVRSFDAPVIWMLPVLVSLAACDTVGPTMDRELVVRGFVQAEESLPSISVYRTGRLDAPYHPRSEHAVRQAHVRMSFEDRSIRYRPKAGMPGVYVPEDEHVQIASRQQFDLEVSWQESEVQATSRVPPRIRIDSFTVDVADQAIEAVFADSISRNVQQGFIYPVDVTLWWTDTTQTRADSLYWIHAQVNPPASFPSAVVGYFLRTSSVVPEERTDRRGRRRQWTGVYGVPVTEETSPLPTHEVTIFLVRSHTDYARYATSRSTPEQREPVSNVSDGRGIVAGISLDSVRVKIGQTGVNK